jgi:predicted DNA-binding antitoxin AbrB/MazE fold protein
MVDGQELSNPVRIRLREGERIRHKVEAAKADETLSARLRRLIEKGEAAERDEARRPQHEAA